MMQKKFVTKNTGRYGKGVFAARDIKKGEVIHVLSGKKMTVRDFIKKVNSDEENIDDPLQVGKRTYIDLDEVSRTFNHNCNPNAILRKRSELFAIKDISSGEEITYDYSLTIAPTEWKMKCECGSENCRKILGDVLSIPKNILKKYREMGAMQDYMKRLLDKIERDGGYKMPKYELLLLKNVKKTSNI